MTVIDPRIVARFQEEMDASRARKAEMAAQQGHLQSQVDDLTNKMNGEDGIQAAITTACNALGITLQ